jgi:2-amino-4-hydroxy-6-hydroxymethyldihydropteridine diphosphokinase
VTRYAIGLGSNLGEREELLRAAVADLDDLFDLAGVSGLYETHPIGGPEQESYLNAVVMVDTALPAPGVLGELHRIEGRHGRERHLRWGPRTLDLDIVTSDGPEIDTPDLVVPHPRASEREFVLRPLCDIWPDALVAGSITAAKALRGLTPQGVVLVRASWTASVTPESPSEDAC